VGHSLGGVIALALAQRRPELVRAVVAYEAPMSWCDWWPKVTAGAVAMSAEVAAEDAAERFMRRIVGDDRWERLPPRTRLQRRAEGPALVAELRSIRDPANPPYEAAALAVPVIAAHGTESSPHHKQTAQRLAQEAPRAELMVVASLVEAESNRDQDRGKVARVIYNRLETDATDGLLQIDAAVNYAQDRDLGIALTT